MKKYDVKVTGQYEKTVTVYAKTPVHAREKIETILFDTDLIDFADEDLVSGEVAITKVLEDSFADQQSENEYFKTDICSDCDYFCPVCGDCMCEDEL